MGVAAASCPVDVTLEKLSQAGPYRFLTIDRIPFMTCTTIIPILLAPLLIPSRAMSQTADWKAVQALLSGTKIKVTRKHGPHCLPCFFDQASYYHINSK